VAIQGEAQLGACPYQFCMWLSRHFDLLFAGVGFSPAECRSEGCGSGGCERRSVETAEGMIEDLPFKAVRSNDHEVLAHAMNLLVARGAYREAARMHPGDLIELRQGCAHRRARSK
jgi:hypothetical protein